MKRLSRSTQYQQVGGRPLPKVFQKLPAICRSEVTMIGGQSNAGKSLLALWQCVFWAQDQIGGIYFSADSSELGQASRALAMTQANLTVPEARFLLEKQDTNATEWIRKIDRLYWSFEEDLSYENINEEVMAYGELWGEMPDYIVIDNLADVEGQSEDEWATQRRALKALVQLARKTDSAVIVLCHTGEDFREDPCPPKKSILGKCSQKPVMIWTTSDQGGRRPVAVVKGRDEKYVDKSGSTAVYLTLNQDTLHFTEGF